jgi:hypothetical protein
MKKINVILVVLVIFTIIAVPVSAMPAIKRIVTPAQLSPPNNERFPTTPHNVTLEWKPVDDPRVTGYLVEIEGYRIDTELWGLARATSIIATCTTYSFEPLYMGGGAVENFFSYRWRVTALAVDAGANSVPSIWQYFSFTPPTSDIRLADIRLVSPANKVKIAEGTPLDFNWELVPGGIGTYLIVVEKLDANKEWKFQSPYWVLSNNPTLPVTTNVYSTVGTHRWRVFGIVDSISYTVSPWRSFTVV